MNTKILIAVCSVLALARAATAADAPAVYAQTGAPLPQAAPNQPPAPAGPGPALDLAIEAGKIAIKACTAIDQKVGVTVLDSAGVPKVVLGSDGVSPRGVQSSTNKALTAIAFKAPTSELDERVKTDTHLAEQINANPTFNTHAGGLVLMNGTTVFGAVGVGGAKGSEKDEQCAKAAFAKLKSGK